jgi:hypothetical protein
MLRIPVPRLRSTSVVRIREAPASFRLVSRVEVASGQGTSHRLSVMLAIVSSALTGRRVPFLGAVGMLLMRISEFSTATRPAMLTRIVIPPVARVPPLVIVLEIMSRHDIPLRPLVRRPLLGRAKLHA